jgi:hypothetical protein
LLTARPHSLSLFFFWHCALGSLPICGCDPCRAAWSAQFAISRRHSNSVSLSRTRFFRTEFPLFVSHCACGNRRNKAKTQSPRVKIAPLLGRNGLPAGHSPHHKPLLSWSAHPEPSLANSYSRIVKQQAHEGRIERSTTRSRIQQRFLAGRNQIGGIRRACVCGTRRRAGGKTWANTA